MAKSHTDLTLKQAEEEIQKSINLRVNLVVGDGVSDSEVRDQVQRLQLALSRVEKLANEPATVDVFDRLRLETGLLINVSREATSRKKSLVAVA